MHVSFSEMLHSKFTTSSVICEQCKTKIEIKFKNNLCNGEKS